MYKGAHQITRQETPFMDINIEKREKTPHDKKPIS
jgi:hypothetical protein